MAYLGDTQLATEVHDNGTITVTAGDRGMEQPRDSPVGSSGKHTQKGWKITSLNRKYRYFIQMFPFFLSYDFVDQSIVQPDCYA